MTDETVLADPSDITPISIVDEMKTSYLDYAMSVIVARALPDVRDGLKPVHRRILYAAQEGGYLPGRAYRKSARLVGDVMGKYHPHGDSSIYDAMARMAQAGARPMTSLQYLLELQRDWARVETYDMTTGVAKVFGGGYGLGIIYAKTMFGAQEGGAAHAA